jgi:hypothetical protein
MKTMHEEWTDKLSEYLDGELADDERIAVEAHLAGCTHCAAVLAELERVVERAQSLQPRPPQADLWAAVAERIDARRSAETVAPVSATGTVSRFGRDSHPFKVAGASRRVSFTVPQLAAAAALLVAVSGGAAWEIGHRAADAARAPAVQASAPAPRTSPDPDADVALDRDAADDRAVATVGMADPQYDAAVADLENAVRKGRGRLDASTIAIVEHNLQIIDQAIDQARQALASDPANSYLSSHLFEARRRKLDLLRRAAAMSSESD